MTGTLKIPFTLLNTLLPEIIAAPIPARKLCSTILLPLNMRFSALLGTEIAVMARIFAASSPAPQRFGRSSKPRRSTIARLSAAAIAKLSR